MFFIVIEVYGLFAKFGYTNYTAIYVWFSNVFSTPQVVSLLWVVLCSVWRLFCHINHISLFFFFRWHRRCDQLGQCQTVSPVSLLTVKFQVFWVDISVFGLSKAVYNNRSLIYCSGSVLTDFLSIIYRGDRHFCICIFGSLVNGKLTENVQISFRPLVC